MGVGMDAFWSALVSGTSGIDRVTHFDPEQYPCKIGSEVNNLEIGNFMDPKEAKRNDRYTQFAVAASKLALSDAGLDPKDVESNRMGVIVGTGIGGMETIEIQSAKLFANGPRRVSPFTIPALIANMASGVVAIELGARGPNFCIVSACSSGAHAIGEGLEMIRRGVADVMVCGGSEAAITQLSYAGFCNMKAMSSRSNDNPTAGCCPFDKRRDGFVMGEGSGLLVLESEEHARARGARIQCELAGYGATCDAHHITSPHPEGDGLALALRMALNSAGIAETEVDYINAHGTATPYNDKFETLAVKKVFGDHAYKLKFSSTKSMTGHLLGAAGGIEAAACVRAIIESRIPPTINYQEPDPDCDLDCVPNTAVDAEVNVAMSNNLGFGGHNATVVLRKYTG